VKKEGVLDSIIAFQMLNKTTSRIYRAKTPRRKEKPSSDFSEPWRALRLCASHLFPISNSKTAQI
jgi:hypothetical protein